MTTTALQQQINELSAQALNLEQSDSGWRLTGVIYARIRELHLELLATQGLYLLGDCLSHVTAYRAHQEAEARARFMAVATPRFIAAHAAIERVTGGRISYSI
ncbi:MAG: hypothetical protein WA154_11070 [Moraxellaceae bacterium]